MNERIKELKHRASVWCDKNIPEQFSEETNGYGKAWEDKFAELIVRECADVCSNVLDYHGILEKFGLEDDTKFGVEE